MINENDDNDDTECDDDTEDITSSIDRHTHTQTHTERYQLTNLDQSSSCLINVSTDFGNSSWQTGFSQR